jgi:hypothetical protein
LAEAAEERKAELEIKNRPHLTPLEKTTTELPPERGDV